MKLVAFLDLDDTVFQRQGGAAEASIVAAVGRDGEPSAWMTARQAAFLEWLRQSATVIPTTGRHREAYSRVRVHFGDQAIIANGGIILDAGGRPAEDWRARIRGAAQERRDGPSLAEVRTYLEGRARTIGAEVKAQVIEDEGLPLYVNLRLLAGDPGELVGLARIAKMAVADGWTVDLGGSNLSVLPPYVSKRLAVEHLLGAMGPDTLTVGIGDSLGDLGFISRCDFAAMPRGSRLFRAIEANAV